MIQGAVERKATSQLIRWCAEAKTWQPEAERMCVGAYCRNDWTFTHPLRIRRALVCSVCEQGYFGKKEFDEHDCYSAY